MGRRPLLPAVLLDGPFNVEEARRAGLARWHLEGKSWRRVGRGAYVWAGLREDAMHRIQTAACLLPAGAVFSGQTAAWLHGLQRDLCDPLEVTVPPGTGVSHRAGLRIRRVALQPSDTTRVRSAPATSAVRTLVDMSRRLSLIEAVVFIDGALYNRKARIGQLESWLGSNAGAHGVRRLREALPFVDPKAESPMESRLRMILVLGGLPRPRAQVSIHDPQGGFVGRLDLYYEQQRLGIEYDGASHRDSLAADNQRQNRLLSAGIRLLRFTASDVLGNPESVVQQVRAMIS